MDQTFTICSLFRNIMTFRLVVDASKFLPDVPYLLVPSQRTTQSESKLDVYTEREQTRFSVYVLKRSSLRYRYVLVPLRVFRTNNSMRLWDNISLTGRYASADANMLTYVVVYPGRPLLRKMCKKLLEKCNFLHPVFLQCNSVVVVSYTWIFG